MAGGLPDKDLYLSYSQDDIVIWRAEDGLVVSLSSALYLKTRLTEDLLFAVHEIGKMKASYHDSQMLRWLRQT